VSLTRLTFELIDFLKNLYVNVRPLEAAKFCRLVGIEVLTGVTRKSSVFWIPYDRTFLQISIHERSRHKLHMAPNILHEFLV
jgi:hypothetical protein